MLLFYFKVFVFLYTRAFFVLHTYNKLNCKIMVQWHSKGGKNNFVPPINKAVGFAAKKRRHHQLFWSIFR